MHESPATRASLLVRLRDVTDGDAWREFARLYAPVIYGFARNRGLQDADAADLMQEVLRSVSGAMSRLEYDPVRGTFRGWLFTVTRNKVFNFLDGRKRRVQGSGDSRVQQRLEQHVDSDGKLSADWEADYQRSLAAQAMERVKHEFQAATWDAFLLPRALACRSVQSMLRKAASSPVYGRRLSACKGTNHERAIQMSQYC
jgi:RNA polymerase sigma-70 factor (ECF subfamily)